MPKFIRLMFVLTLICTISASALAYVYNDIAAPVIEERRISTALAILNQTLPGADNYNFIDDETSGTTIYYTAEKNGNIFGVAVPTKAIGFGGAIELMVIYDVNGTITGAQVLNQTETPGYGDRIITEPWFVEQFTGKTINDEMIVDQTIDKLAGATISSKATTKAINKSATIFKNYYLSGGDNR